MKDNSAAAVDLLGHLLQDPAIAKRLWIVENQNLTLEDVCDLLRCGETKLRGLIRDGKWIMVAGPSGRLEMTPDQFREQRRILMSMDKRR
ncbi:MAG: hypothetical protein AAF564_17775 [Bacteroidota bacterium]